MLILRPLELNFITDVWLDGWIRMNGERAVVDLTKSDTRFLRRLSQEFGASELSACFQCGVCTASCPIRELDDTFNPRKIMKLAKLGLKDQVLNNEFIWLCSMCFVCLERCPQDVRPPEVMTVLRNMAAKEGLAPPNLMKLVQILAEKGRIYEIDDFIEDERDDRELPPVEAEPETIKKIAGA
ncbi:4Fe-4S dicluster domain-containing protein [Candidatus Bathyarchaeota archaeon]|nr:MAG: 4Fe-4S dicluster domain-containing protein [Candidatus Bathyarchaeota archaeon]